MSATHEIVWEFDRDRVNAKAVCNDLDCVHRYRCAESCELLFDVTKHGNGYRHPVTDSPTSIWHEMYKGDECSFIEWLDADPGILPELCASKDMFEIGRTAVLPEWQGEDGVLWKRA